jgi:hypothetical protein
MHIIEYAVVSNGKKNLNTMELNAIWVNNPKESKLY